MSFRYSELKWNGWLQSKHLTRLDHQVFFSFFLIISLCMFIKNTFVFLNGRVWRGRGLSDMVYAGGTSSSSSTKEINRYTLSFHSSPPFLAKLIPLLLCCSTKRRDRVIHSPNKKELIIKLLNIQWAPSTPSPTYTPQLLLNIQCWYLLLL